MQCEQHELTRKVDAMTAALSAIGKALDIALDVCRGLYYLHTFAMGAIIHRDMKPGGFWFCESRGIIIYAKKQTTCF